jgi:hypothetical protein
MSQIEGNASHRSEDDERREFRAWLLSLGTAASHRTRRDVIEKISIALCSLGALALYVDILGDDALSLGPLAMVALVARAAYLLGARSGREVGSHETGARWAAAETEARARRID